MDLSRRAPTPTPIPENRRIADIYRPITTAAFGTAVPLVIGQQRVPSTVYRDGRTADAGRRNIPSGEISKILYGLCEGPIVSIPKEFTNNSGFVNPGYASGTAAHVTLPIPHVSIDPPTDGSSPSDLSFEVSSDIAIAGNAQGTYVVSLATGSNVRNEDLFSLPTQVCSDFHVASTATTQWMVRYDRSTNLILARSRAVGGAWGADITICSGSVNSSLRPDASATMVQPRIAVTGSLVHIIWSVLTDAGSAVQIAHVWSSDGGTTWTTGQSLSRPSITSTSGVRRLQIALHSSGEVWVSFHRYSAYVGSQSAFPSKGVVVGFLPSTANSSNAWILPSMNSGATSPSALRVPLADGELVLTDSSSEGANWASYALLNLYRLRAPSILPLGGGKAVLSATFTNRPQTSPQNLVVAPIIATTEVAWDLPSTAFNLFGTTTASHNIASISWLQSNGFSPQPLARTPNATVDLLNDGSTQIFATGTGTFGVLVLSQLQDLSNYILPKTPEYFEQLGVWRLPFGSWDGTTFAWTTPLANSWSATGFQATAYCNANGQVYVGMGDIVFPRNPSSWSLTLSAILPGQAAASQVFTYSPGTAVDDSLMYQFWAQDASMLTSISENEISGGSGNLNVGIREVVKSSGLGDMLPSLICKRLLTADLRGLNIQNVAFDDTTWNQFDNYCLAMGIKFSLVLTSQQAAWPLVCDILESANTIPYRSEGMIKVLVRETVAITANGATFTPIWNASSTVPILESEFRDGIQVENQAMDAAWNSLRVNWKNRSRNYADEPYQIDNAGSVARKGRIPASAMDWPWICELNVVAVCAWLRLRQQIRAPLTYRFALSQKFMLLEVGDIIRISWGSTISARYVRILSIEEGDADWREFEAEDAPINTTAISAPAGGGGSSVPTLPTIAPVNLPIIFVAAIGGGSMQSKIYCLLSWPSSGRGCNVWQSWDGVTYTQIGSCTTPSPTGHLIQDMVRLRIGPGLRCHPGLRAGASDFAVGDYSESGVTPPYPDWTGYQNGLVGSLLWIDGELVSYAVESDSADVATCSVLKRGRYGTTVGPHATLSRIGAVTDAAWTMVVPSGRSGQTCYFKFPAIGENVSTVAHYTVGIP